MEHKNFDEVASAYEQVKKTGDSLKADYEQTRKEIEAAETELEALPLAPVPFEDMKAAILDFVDASGERHAEELRTFIADFANGRTGWGNGAGGVGMVDLHDVGKPLRFSILQEAILGGRSAASGAKLLTGGMVGLVDRAFYYFCAGLIREGLQKTMDRMTPEEFGYDKIRAKDVGTPRHERVAAIASLEERLAELRSRKAELAGKLYKLGFDVPPTARRKP